jgi:tRNA threonylcarbamoyladenosine biosynthesis protein TsaB
MFSLILDTSTERGIVALADDGRVLKEVPLPFGLQNSKYVLSYINQLFLEYSLKPSDLGRIIMGTGPGSYTGIRVGASIAYSMAFALKIPLVGVSALRAFVPDASDSFVALIDAKIAGAYVSFNGQAPYVKSIDELKPLLEKHRIFVAPTIESLKKKLELSDVAWYERGPSALKMLELSMLEDAQFSKEAIVKLNYLNEWRPS